MRSILDRPAFFCDNRWVVTWNSPLEVCGFLSSNQRAAADSIRHGSAAFLLAAVPQMGAVGNLLNMEKKKVAALLEQIGTLLELKGESPFKIRAYLNAARVIEGLGGELDALVASGEIRNLKGIGEALSQKIGELARTGSLKYYEELRASFPEGILRMLEISGLGPKKIKVLYERLGITSIAELRDACESDRLLTLDGFGSKTQEKILQGIHYLQQHQDHHLLSVALGEGHQILQALENHGEIIRLSLAGSLRRHMEIVRNIDLIASARNERSVMEYFSRLPQVKRVIALEENNSRVLLKSEIYADLRLVSDVEFPFALLHFTGSREHNTALRARAEVKGMKINEHGLFREGALIQCQDEFQIFAQVGLSYIPPELREGMGEIEAAESGQLPKLLEIGDICGLFHVHTTYSDGAATLEEIALAAKARGYQYIGIADHSQSAVYARGLKVEEVNRQHAEIDRLNKELKPFRILKGIESDILPDGSLDYTDEVLASFDFVIASVHSRFNLPEEQMTHRICQALMNRHVTMLAHPTGRLLLSREPYAVNLKKVIETAASRRVIVEINAHPMRLDLDWRILKYAKGLGMMTAINPDAHDVAGLDDIRFGVGIARKGWLESRDILNTRSLQGVMDFLESRTRQ